MWILINLLLTFFKIGLFSFGGGYAMIPFMQREIIEKHEWLSLGEFMDVIGISQMTPGPVSINSATFVGYKTSGFLGSVFATTGMILVSFILVSLISKIMIKFKDSEYLKAALLGMKPVLIALIIHAFIDLAKEAYVDIKSIVITLIIGVCLLSKKVHPILTIVIAAILGIIFYGCI